MARYFIISIGIILLTACSAGKISVSSLSTTWTMDKVYEKKVNVTNRENPNRDRYISFQADGTFMSGGEPYGDVTGTWEILPDRTLLITPSNHDEVGTSQWIATIKGATMVWRGTGNDELERLEVHWLKK